MSDISADHVVRLLEYVGMTPQHDPSFTNREQLISEIVEQTKPLISLVTTGVWHDRDRLHIDSSLRTARWGVSHAPSSRGRLPRSTRFKDHQGQ